MRRGGREAEAEGGAGVCTRARPPPIPPLPPSRAATSPSLGPRSTTSCSTPAAPPSWARSTPPWASPPASWPRPRRPWPALATHRPRRRGAGGGGGGAGWFERSLFFRSAPPPKQTTLTSSPPSRYTMAHVETFRGVAKGDRLWQLGLGGGFKCTSGVWRAVRAVSEAHAAWGPGVGAAAEGEAAAAPAAGACMLDEVRGGREGLGRGGAGCRARAVRPPLPPSSLRPPPCRLRPRRDPPHTHHTPARRARGATRASRVGGEARGRAAACMQLFLGGGPTRARRPHLTRSQQHGHNDTHGASAARGRGGPCAWPPHKGGGRWGPRRALGRHTRLTGDTG